MLLVKRIQNLCQNKNMSLPKLERELKFGKGSIYNWDTNSPSINKVIKVAQYFGVTVDYLVIEDDVLDDESAHSSVRDSA
ncbi:transcriptional regulator with XRE-family HTH domain [Sporomusaceae bacterium BoRhaA]|uniref:helix-turn-helix domain-containing protein n=1 Tax=Pelorhabdus rhamnosifermentans TaxID=2772457 RepID=UPI001C063436|nr:helix-turn-helix transcriptional regulator [Pelorhabdus rhamnosifermentans]MBU2701757.1 transcriptional regulator with XRE-family HTH domain [Pelorhabdus rhamnosifermentans]